MGVLSRASEVDEGQDFLGLPLPLPFLDLISLDGLFETPEALDLTEEAGTSTNIDGGVGSILGGFSEALEILVVLELADFVDLADLAFEDIVATTDGV